MDGFATQAGHLKLHLASTCRAVAELFTSPRSLVPSTVHLASRQSIASYQDILARTVLKVHLFRAARTPPLTIEARGVLAFISGTVVISGCAHIWHISIVNLGEALANATMISRLGLGPWLLYVIMYAASEVPSGEDTVGALLTWLTELSLAHGGPDGHYRC